MSNEKDDRPYNPEMRGALYEETDRKSDKSPIATGKITISGVELRVAMWPAQVSKGESKKKYWPVKVEYRQGATKFLVPISPTDVVVTSAKADAPSEDAAPEVSDMPF